MERPSPLPDHTHVRQAIVVAVRAGVPVLLWGPPGEGKSRTVETLAEALGWHSETVVGSIREAADFAGLPERTPGGIVLHAPRWAHRCSEAERSLLFLDELTTATPPVQAAMLRVVLDREVGDLRLPDTVSIVAAANPPEQAADGYDLAPPLANRFCHLWFQADVNLWCDGLESEWSEVVNPQDPIEVDQVTAAAVRADWRRLVADFIRLHPDALRDQVTVETGSTAWASPRTWHMACRLGAEAELSGVEAEVIHLLLAGTVGEGAGIELLDHYRNRRGFDELRSMLDTDDGTFPTGMSPLWLHAALGSIVDLVAAELSEARWSRGIRRLVEAAETYGPDVVVTALEELLRLRKPDWVLPDGIASFGRYLDQVGE